MERNSTLLRVISMNNIATILLKQGMYRDAMQALGDAIFSVRQQQIVEETTLIHQNNNNKISSKICGVADDSMIKYRHLRVEMMLFCASNDRTGGLESIIADFLYTNDIDCFHDVERILVSHISRSPRLFPIYIDDLDEMDNSNNMDFTSSVVFYNCGIAHICLWRSLSRSVDSPAYANFHFSMAIQLLELSHELTSETVSHLEDKETVFATKLIYMDAVIMSTLLLILQSKLSDRNLTQSMHHLYTTKINIFQSYFFHLICTTKMTTSKTDDIFYNIQKHASAC
jgi:hypothetical protein